MWKHCPWYSWQAPPLEKAEAKLIYKGITYKLAYSANEISYFITPVS